MLSQNHTYLTVLVCHRKDIESVDRLNSERNTRSEIQSVRHWLKTNYWFVLALLLFVISLKKFSLILWCDIDEYAAKTLSLLTTGSSPFGRGRGGKDFLMSGVRGMCH